jgi:octanoyl-[GcvH]:protein N-octanoyltransferase
VVVQFHRGPLSGEDQALELAVAHALVRLASRGEVTEAVRIYRPTAPVAVFGRRDTHLPGFAAATRAAAAAGFEPLVRATGGRAVAYTGNAIVVDHVGHDPAVIGTHERRFQVFGEAIAELLRGLGIAARVGAVPGEYCPGAYSVNARGTVKLVGTAQRIVKNAWLFSSLIIVGDEHRLRPVLAEVYGNLGQPFDPASVGSLTGEQPTLTIGDVEGALMNAYRITPPGAQPLAPETVALARDLLDRHRV